MKLFNDKILHFKWINNEYEYLYAKQYSNDF